MNRAIGLTSTVPSEVILAAGDRPVDLNNIFITSTDPYALVESAEAAGFPRNYCAWIKGIYGVLLTRPDIETVVGVMQGDCGNTAALTDVLKNEGREVVPFAYPANRETGLLFEEMDRLAAVFQTNMEEAEAWRLKLQDVRELAKKIDEMTWRDGLITGQENHEALVGMSDFTGDPASYNTHLGALIETAEHRDFVKPKVRIGLVGVPPILGDIYDSIAGQGAGVVYNEVQREFSMPHEAANLAGQYAAYTYPYGSNARAAEIKKQIGLRQIDGIVHYVQSFCYHQLDDIVFREALGLPVLRLEADRPGAMDERSRLRLEAFIETLGG